MNNKTMSKISVNRTITTGGSVYSNVENSKISQINWLLVSLNRIINK